MVLHRIEELPVNLLLEESENKQVILLYPWSNYHNLFLSYFLNAYQNQVFYFRLQDKHDLQRFTAAVIQELADHYDSPANLLSLADEDQTPAELGEILASAFNALQGELKIIYLDELDRIPQDETFRDFINHFLAQLNPDYRLIVNSRMLRYLPWKDLLDDEKAIIVGNAAYINHLRFYVDESPKPQLEVNAFGRGRVLLDGQELDRWDGALPRNLLFFLIDHEAVTRDDIFNLFWPELTVKEATNVFHVTKRKINELLSEYAGTELELTRYSAGFYLPSDKVVRHYDVAVFENAVDQALTTQDNLLQKKLFLHAQEIYRGDFLQMVDMPWAINRREELSRKYIECLRGLAYHYMREEAYDAALTMMRRAVQEAPISEDLQLELMRLYLKLNRPLDALKQYQWTEQYLLDTYNMGVSKPMREIYEQIQIKLTTPDYH
ncbi:hypothetical protein MASR2M15_17450 [Anaerolineales bacterium]